MLVERAPLPPHERSWRHPSEVGPTRNDVDNGARGRVVVLVLGTLATVMVVAMVVAVTPRPSDGPVALSATTTPAQSQTTALPRAAASPRIITANRAPRLASFVAIPNAIASSPDVAETAVAESLPGDDDLVVVRTEHVTYRVAWRDLALLRLDAGAVMLDGEAEIVAHIEGGEIVVLVDD